jgi:predicted DNA-binding transcriptional regulator AlpA
LTGWSSWTILADVPPRDLIGTAEAAEVAGVSVPTIKRVARMLRLPIAVRMPGRTGALLFERADVEAYRDSRDADRREAAS